MKKRARLFSPLIQLTLASIFLMTSLPASVLQHERLRVRNTFKTPEEVISYYCARDASGFVWSGLLDAERKAFTLWKEGPQNDSFYVAERYFVGSGQTIAHNPDHVSIDVKYELAAISDAHGTKSPAPQKEYHVTFDLKKVEGVWKIAKPEAEQIAPVVLEEKFPITNSQ